MLSIKNSNYKNITLIYYKLKEIKIPYQISAGIFFWSIFNWLIKSLHTY